MEGGTDPYAVLAAWLGGVAVGMSLVGWAMVKREHEREQETRRAERRVRGRWNG